MTIRDFISKISARKLWVNLAGMAATIIMLLLLTLLALNVYTKHGQEISVPNVTGMKYEQAAKVLEDAGLTVEVADSGYVRQLPAGTILRQSISAGHKVKTGRTVSLTVNSGSSPTIIMPDLADNSSLREAESRLRAMGFNLGKTEYRTGEQDWVYAVKANGRNVAAGTRISSDAVITLVVGNGQSDEETIDVDSANELYWDDENFYLDNLSSEPKAEESETHR